MATDDRTTGRRGRPRQFDAEQVLEKAMMAFWCGSYAATGMTDLLTEMGVARQSAYNTFGGKHDLFLAALERYGATRMAGLVSPLDDPEAGLDEVRTVLTWWGTSGTLAGRTGCLLVNTLAEFGSGNPEVAEIVMGQVADVRNKIRSGLDRTWRPGGSANIDQLDRISLLLVGVAVGLNLLGKLGVPAEDLENAIDSLMTLLADEADPSSTY
jgi:TetR/AcrR family transcriptional repressor of nem operon